MTKSFVLPFSEAIANELEDSGVTVTALCPGPTSSGFQKRANMEDSKLVSGKKIMAQASRFTPRNLMVKVVRNMQERTH